MYFKRLEIHGFKSFAEPAVIDFHEGVTCIVGPNGSGKSNISDALRWVLGEQSPKALRGGKMEEVIFNGTLNRKSRGMAEVTLVIDNSTGILPVDYSEVSITRRMYRSGESEYLINNNNCRLRDIRELIMDTGIGVDGYSIIGQGRIQSIIDGKPEQRREILEESAGIVMYKTKKGDAERKLSNTQINLDRVNDIIGEIEGRIDGLKTDSEKAKEFLELREKKKELDINITLRNVEKFAESNEVSKADVLHLDEELSKLSTEKIEVDKKLEDSRFRAENLEKLATEARDKKLEKSNQLHEISSKSQLDTEKLSSIERDEKRLSDEINSLQIKIGQELQNAEAEEEKKKKHETVVSNAQTDLANAISRYNEVTSKSFSLNSELEDIKNDIMDLTTKARGYRSEAESYESYTVTLNTQKKNILETSKDIFNNKKQVEEALLKAKEDKVKNEAELVNINNNIDNQNNAKLKLQEEIQKLKKEAENLKIISSQTNSRIKTIEEMEANYDGFNSGVRFIMHSDLSGICGVVAELIKVPKGYEIAIETALGQTMQNIVCEKDEDAKKAINLLKKNLAGRLTFLPIESIKAETKKLSDTTQVSLGFLGLASDIIQYDKKYENVMKYLLGRTVIVKDMDTAIKLSKIQGAGIRFVTVEGEIVNPTGSMTGGKYKNATQNIFSRRVEILSLKEKLKDLEKEYSKNDITIQENEEKVLAIVKYTTDLTNKRHELEIINADLKAKISSLSDSAIDQEASAKKREIELKDIEEGLAKTESLVKKAFSDAKSCDQQIIGLNSEVDLKLFEIESLQKDLEDANEHVTQARTYKTKVETEVDNIDQVLKLLLDKIDEYTEEVEIKQDELDKLLLKKAGFSDLDENSEEVLKTLSKELEDLDDYINKVTLEKQELSEEINKEQALQTNLGNKINSYRDQKQSEEIKLTQNETRLDIAKQKLLEDYEISYAQALELKKEDFVYSTAVKESREIKNRIDELGDINVGSIKEYNEVKERYDFLSEQRADITVAMDELKSIILDMDRIIKVKFKENFDQVVVNFEETFKELFGGGQAELRIDNEDNPLEAGIEIVAQPPGKKLQNINLLSGGEKTMTAIALMFAVLKTKPTPFCILDEIEAALDDANTDRFANYLKNFNEIQFAIITHQKVTMEHADVLYGVTMPEQGISKLLSLRMGDDFEI